MLDDFKRVLARVQRDYGFYIDCQVSPAVALAGYDLSPEERSVLGDPEKLAVALNSGIGIARIPSITVKISGKHDWVNRAGPTKQAMDASGREAIVATQVEAIRTAGTEPERKAAVLRLMELIG